METAFSAQLAYFSGTGGTARAAELLAQALRQGGIAVTLTPLEGQPSAPIAADWQIILFPVYAANAPQPVDEWVAALPPCRRKRAAVISVSGGGEISPNTACRAPTIRKLERKGYAVIYENMLVMPSNLILRYPDALSALILRAAPRKTAAMAAGLLSGQVRRVRPLWRDRVLTRLCAVEKRGSRLFGKRLKADARCVDCGWCAEHCPRGNIALRGGRPVFGNRCVLCLRCVYGCPQKAIVPGLLRSMVLKDGFNLAALEADMSGVTALPPVKTLTNGRVLRGVREYLLYDD